MYVRTYVVTMEDKFDSAVAHSLENLQESLLRLSSFQKDALKSIVSGNDNFVRLPMGHGKSILFECVPHCLDLLSCNKEHPLSSVFVISPLIELMKST